MRLQNTLSQRERPAHRPSGSYKVAPLRVQSKHGADCSAESRPDSMWLRSRVPRAEIVSLTCQCVSPKHQEEPAHRGGMRLRDDHERSLDSCAPSAAPRTGVSRLRAAACEPLPACRRLCAAACAVASRALHVAFRGRPHGKLASRALQVHESRALQRPELSMPWDSTRPSARVPRPACRAPRVRGLQSGRHLCFQPQLAISLNSPVSSPSPRP